MCKRSESHLGRWLGAVAAVSLATINPSAATVTSPTPAADDAGAARERAGYHLRCWQEGRLLFEDSPVTLPASPAAMRVVAHDRSGRPIYLLELAHAMCQLRHRDDRGERRAWP
jgi:hypothetical protein